MSNERLEALLSAALDDALTPDERIELDELLASADAAELKGEYSAMEHALRESAELTPPADLHHRILDQARLPSQARKSATTGAGWSGFPALLRYGLAAAAGVILTIAIQNTGTSDMAGVESMVGTMAPAASGEQVLDRLQLQTGVFESIATLQQRTDSLYLELELAATAPVDVRVDLTGLSAGVAALTGLDEPFQSMTLQDGIVLLKGHGRHRLQVLLDGSAAVDGETVSLEFSSEGRLLEAGKLRVAQ